MDASNQSRGMRPLPLLPQEIITEILLILPVKSLLKFRSVSKSWLSLISSSKFIKTHLNNSTKSNDYSKHSLILATNAVPVTYYTCSLSSILSNTVMENSRAFEFPISSPYYRFWFVGTCNGLLCVSVDPDTLVLYNPWIRSLKTLPVSGTDMETSIRVSLGFCYDEVNDDYKVAELSMFCDRTSRYRVEVKVYSLRNDSWRSMESRYFGFDFSGGAVNVGGILHWWCMYKKDGSSLIFAVNTVTYRCDILAPTKQHGKIGGEAEWGLVELDGCLGVYYDYYGRGLDVWAMKEYGVNESWTKLVSIPYPENLHSYLRPLFMLKNAHIFLNCELYTMIYDSRNNSFTTREIHTIGGVCSVAAPTYVESLVSTSLVGG